MASPDALIRIALGADGGLVVGRTAPGRGAWLCKDSAPCLAAAERRKAFSRALRADVGPEAVEGLQSTLSDRARMVGE